MNDTNAERWKKAVRAWSERPPHMTADAAREAVLGRVAGKAQKRPWHTLAAAAALAILMLFAILLATGQRVFNTPTETATETTRSSSTVVVLTLDSGTTFYYPLQEEN